MGLYIAGRASVLSFPCLGSPWLPEKERSRLKKVLLQVAKETFPKKLILCGRVL
jgi:hypothetical protein